MGNALLCSGTHTNCKSVSQHFKCIAKKVTEKFQHLMKEQQKKLSKKKKRKMHCQGQACCSALSVLPQECNGLHLCSQQDPKNIHIMEISCHLFLLLYVGWNDSNNKFLTIAQCKGRTVVRFCQQGKTIRSPSFGQEAYKTFIQQEAGVRTCWFFFSIFKAW